MIKVVNVGETRRVLNPANQKWTLMVLVTFEEEGRGGANKSLSDTARFLSDAVGANVGLTQIRRHTQLILADQAHKFPVGQEFPTLFINRQLYSTPQMRQQSDVEARMLEGRPTYFVTEISNQAKEDADNRPSIESIFQNAPDKLFEARFGGAVIERVENNGGTVKQVSAGQETLAD